jgi:glucose-6-phosphate 1-epimerase
MLERFQGQQAHRLSLSNGDTVLVADQGAQVLSWVSLGKERLYLSPRSVWDGRTAIRGGVPVCFPQFNQRGVDGQGRPDAAQPSLPKHGFVRNMTWALHEAQATDHAASLHMVLRSSAVSLALWSQAFELRLAVSLEPQILRVTLTVCNTDTKPLQFTGALHTYLAVNQLADTQLHGLHACTEWDALHNTQGLGLDPLRFDAPFDRVYTASTTPLRQTCGSASGQSIEITQSPAWANTVVWNPGAALCATLPDLPPNAHAHMLCVEAAQVFAPITVPPKQAWQAWQSLRVM